MQNVCIFLPYITVARTAGVDRNDEIASLSPNVMPLYSNSNLPLRLNYCSSDSKNQLAKIHNASLNTSHSARILGFIFDKHLTFSNQLTSFFNACYYHIYWRYCLSLPRFVNCLAACTIATCIVHSKLDYYNSRYYKLYKSQLSCLQQIQNSCSYCC